MTFSQEEREFYFQRISLQRTSYLSEHIYIEFEEHRDIEIEVQPQRQDEIELGDAEDTAVGQFTTMMAFH